MSYSALIIIYYCSLIINGYFNGGLSKSNGHNGGRYYPQLVIYLRKSWADYLIILAKNRSWMFQVLTSDHVSELSDIKIIQKFWQPCLIAGYRDVIRP